MRRSLIWLLILVASGCIDSVNLSTGVGGTLVVDGWITDQAGPYSIRLSRSISYDNSRPLKTYTVPESNATVTIVTHTGEEERLVESTVKGTYKNPLTSTFTGKVGSAYRLLIKTANGNMYHSAFDTLKPVPPISKLNAKYKIITSLIMNAAGKSVTQKRESFDISVELSDPAGIANYYRWQSDGIFEFFSITDFSALKQCWAPYQSKIEPVIAVASDRDFDGKTFQQVIGNIIYDRPTKFLVKTKQQSLSAAAYKFLKGISLQGSSTGTLFDPPPAPLSGNIICDSNPSENVLGFFGCSSVTSSAYLIDRLKESGFVGPAQNIPAVPGDCRTQQPGATNIKPEGF